MTDLIVRRDGTCLPSTATSCWQRFRYEWNEVGELTRARRWDLTTAEQTGTENDIQEDPPTRSADADLAYTYDAGGNRVLKTSGTKHTVTIFGSLELRNTTWDTGASPPDYVFDYTTIQLLVPAGPATARIFYATESLPMLTSGQQHVFFNFPDHLGSTAFLIDKATGELVEFGTYQAYGAAESDHRPSRWAAFREPLRFSGKEEDIEVGLAYFGARYYSPFLLTWLSPDRVTIHELGSDMNPYAYVRGSPLMGIDPDGNEVVTAILVGAAVGAVIAGTTNAVVQQATTGHVNWGWDGVAGAATVGAIAGAVTGLVGYGISSATSVWSGSSGTAGKALLTGAGTGATGGGASWGAQAILPGMEPSSGFGESVGIGAAIGLGFGALQAGAVGLNAADNATSATKTDTRSVPAKLAEGALVSAGQGATAYGTMALLNEWEIVKTPDWLMWTAVGSAAFNGGLAGYHGVYNWEGMGWAAATLDASTNLLGTTLGNIQNITGMISGTYVEAASYRQNRFVYTSGFGLKANHAFTAGGPVVTNWPQGDYTLLNNHENLHLWQSRLTGPVFQMTYVAWFIGGGGVGALRLVMGGRRLRWVC